MISKIREWSGEISPTFFFVEDFFTKKTTKGIISRESAAIMYGFSEIMNKKNNITYPKGYNSKKNHSNIIINYNSPSKYDFQVETYKFNNIIFNIHTPERAIVEVVKNAKGSFNDALIKTVKNFFISVEYNVEKLYEAAKMFNIEKEIQVFESMVLYG